MIKRIAAATAALGMLAAGPALAADAATAQVSAIKGAVMVSQDGKLTAVTRDSALRSGDRVVAKDGQATLRYADGCQVTLKSGAMATVGAASPCAGGQGLVNASNGSSAQGAFGMGDFGLALIGWGILAITMFVVADDDDSVSP